MKPNQAQCMGPEGRSESPKAVEYTPEPWRLMEDTSQHVWVVVGESPTRGNHEVARIANGASTVECRANARLIAQAPAMHRAAVKLMCLWGTADAQEAMEELALILSKAVRP